MSQCGEISKFNKKNGSRFSLGPINICCPACKTSIVGPYGTRGRKNDRVEVFQCKNSNCKNEDHKTAKQFILTTSYKFKALIDTKLQELFEDLLKDGAKNKTPMQF